MHQQRIAMQDNQTQPTSPDKPHGGWTRIDNAVLPVLAKIHGMAIAVYVALKSYADRDGVCFPAQEDIGRLAGVSVHTVVRIISAIAQAGLIVISKRSTGGGRLSNLYRFVDYQNAPQAHCGGTKVPDRHLQSAPQASAKCLTGRTTRTTEPDPLNKIHSKRESAAIDLHLLEVIDQWNLIAPTIGAPLVQRDPPSKAVLACWKRLKKDPELREAFQDTPAIMAAVRKAKCAHGQPWFDLTFLFTKDQHRQQLRVHRLLNGVYDRPYNNNNGNHQQHGVGPGQVSDGTRPPGFGNGLTD
jgi:hypothetical protein